MTAAIDPLTLRAPEGMTRSFSRPIHPDWLHCSSVTHGEWAPLLAPCHPGGSIAILDRLIPAGALHAARASRARSRRAC